MISLQDVEVELDGHAAQGRLVFRDGKLVAVLVMLSEQFYEHNRGRWFIETTFNSSIALTEPFSDLDSAVEWIARSQ